MGEFCEFEIDFEQFDDLRAVVVHDECGAHEDVWFYRFDGLKAENAELRELLAELYQCLRQIGCDHCGDGYRRMCSVLNHLRELGIEVVV